MSESQATYNGFGDRVVACTECGKEWVYASDARNCPRCGMGVYQFRHCSLCDTVMRVSIYAVQDDKEICPCCDERSMTAITIAEGMRFCSDPKRTLWYITRVE